MTTQNQQEWSSNCGYCAWDQSKTIFYVYSLNTDVQHDAFGKPKGLAQEQSQFVHKLCNKST